MKKLIAILLTFVVSSITLGSQFVNGKSNSVTEVYATGSVDFGDPERSLLFNDLCQTFNAEITDYQFGGETLKGTIDPEAGSPEFEVTYSDEYTVGYILFYEFGHRGQAEIIEYQLVDNTPSEFTGEMSIYYNGETEQINFFDIMTDEEYFPIEEAGEGEDDNNTIVETGELSNVKKPKGEECEPCILEFILPAIAAKIAALAVAATIVIVAASLPIYCDSSLTPASVGSNVIDGFYLVLDSVKYQFAKLKEKFREISKQNHYKKEGKAYYATIPITESNVHVYRRLQLSVGDMLIINYPVNESKAISMLRKGYSIYSYYASFTVSALEKAWVGDVIQEDCDQINYGYYQHYHAYPLHSNKKRSGIIDGVRINIHGFYGEPA